MTLDELTRPALVRYHSTQQGVPDAEHERHFVLAARSATGWWSASRHGPALPASLTAPLSGTPRHVRCAGHSTTWSGNYQPPDAVADGRQAIVSTGIASGCGARDSISTIRLSAAEMRMPRATSTTCRPRLPEARSGRSAAIASTSSCRPMPRASRSPRADERDVLPALAPAPHADGPVEAVRVRERDHALGAVDLEVADVLAVRLEARDEVGGHAALELHRRGRMRGSRDGEPLARARADLDRALARPRRGEARDARHRPEQRDDGGQVVRAHVEQRAGSVREEDVRVRVPALLSADEHRGAHRQRLADRARVEQRPAGLVGAAEERVRCAPDAQPEPAAPRRRAPRRRRSPSPAASRCRRACPPRGRRGSRPRAPPVESG